MRYKYSKKQATLTILNSQWNPVNSVTTRQQKSDCINSMAILKGFSELTRDISFQIPPSPPLSQQTHKISQVYHLTEEINCRSDSFIAPSKALVNRGRGSVGTSNNASPEAYFGLISF